MSLKLILFYIDDITPTFVAIIEPVLAPVIDTALEVLPIDSPTTFA